MIQIFNSNSTFNISINTATITNPHFSRFTLLLILCGDGMGGENIGKNTKRLCFLFRSKRHVLCILSSLDGGEKNMLSPNPLPPTSSSGNLGDPKLSKKILEEHMLSDILRKGSSNIILDFLLLGGSNLIILLFFEEVEEIVKIPRIRSKNLGKKLFPPKYKEREVFLLLLSRNNILLIIKPAPYLM